MTSDDEADAELEGLVNNKEIAPKLYYNWKSSNGRYYFLLEKIRDAPNLLSLFDKIGAHMKQGYAVQDFKLFLWKLDVFNDLEDVPYASENYVSATFEVDLKILRCVTRSLIDQISAMQSALHSHGDLSAKNVGYNIIKSSAGCSSFKTYIYTILLIAVRHIPNERIQKCCKY